MYLRHVLLILPKILLPGRIWFWSVPDCSCFYTILCLFSLCYDVSLKTSQMCRNVVCQTVKQSFAHYYNQYTDCDSDALHIILHSRNITFCFFGLSVCLLLLSLLLISSKVNIVVRNVKHLFLAFVSMATSQQNITCIFSFIVSEVRFYNGVWC